MDTQEPSTSSDIDLAQYDGRQAQASPVGFYGLLDAIRATPPMFLGKTSLHDLDMYLRGYFICKWVMKVEDSEEEREFGEFDEFVQKKYRWRDSAGWAAKIQYKYRAEDGAFREFFKLLDEFRESKRKLSSRPSSRKNKS